MRENIIVSRRGGVSLPGRMRKRLGIKPGDVLIVEERGSELVLRPAAVIELDTYSDEQITAWDQEDQLSEMEHLAIRDRLRAIAS